MPRRTIALPASATLPDTPWLRSAEVRQALGGVSKAVVHLWRVRHNLPRGVRVGNDTRTDADELAAWLRERGVLVSVVPVSPEPAAPAAPMPSPWPAGDPRHGAHRTMEVAR